MLVPPSCVEERELGLHMLLPAEACHGFCCVCVVARGGSRGLCYSSLTRGAKGDGAIHVPGCVVYGRGWGHVFLTCVGYGVR